MLGYSPADSVTSGAFRAISVRVKRPGLIVRARRGYVASAPPVTASAPAPAPPASASSDSASDAVSESARESLSPPTTGFERHTDATTEVPGVRLRPDSNARVQELAAREGVAVAASDLASRGWEQYQNGDVEGAANLLGKAAIDPNARPWVHYALGFSELALRHFDKAARAWERVRAAVPEFRTVYLDLADAYRQQESYGRAIDVLRAADARWPADADVLNAMGTIQVRRGALDDAIGTFRRATGAHPDEALAYFNLGRSYELRYFKRRRFSQSDGRWMANSADVKNAIAAYEEYVKLGGPFETQARNAIQNLQWLR